jgi:hypothetical protein
MLSRRILIVLLVLFAVCTAYFAHRWHQAESRRVEALHWTRFVMDSLGTSLNLPTPPVGSEGRDSIYWQWVATSAQLQSRRWAQAVRHWVELRSTLLDEVDIAGLKQEGLEDPPKQLRESLDSRSDLIPFPGVHGTMSFVPESIVLLEPHFAFAKFEDGLVGGSILLEYEVLTGGKIGWKRLWAALD